MRTRRLGPTAAALALPLLISGALLAGCSDDSATATDQESSQGDEPSGASSPDEESTAPAGPACSEIWVVGETLPAGYQACVEGGSEIEPESRYCESGQRLLTHEDRFWAVQGGRIMETDGETVDDDQRYRDTVASCTA